MPTITRREDGGTLYETTMRYTVELLYHGSTPPSVFGHESDGAALARVTALLVKYPAAQVAEERVIDLHRPIAVKYTVKVPPRAW